MDQRPHSHAPKSLLDTSNARHCQSVGRIACMRFGRMLLSAVAKETCSQAYCHQQREFSEDCVYQGLHMISHRILNN